MNLTRHVALFAGIALFGGCAQPDHVLFVTDTSIGFNVDNKPPSISIAYNRIEGYIGPRYQNGAVPPVVASIATGGSIFNPKISELYATGAAAVKAVGTEDADDGEFELKGEPKQKKLVFFGTTTTIGIKAGFDATGNPESLIFGYKRKELSFIPLATKSTTNGVDADVYPSVLASIDTTTIAKSLPDSGLTSQQFFATGQAAETLALNPLVRKTFASLTENAVINTLSPTQRQAAIDQGNKDTANQKTKIDQVMAYVAPNDTLDSSKLTGLITAANRKAPGTVNEDFKQEQTAASLKLRLLGDQPTVASLYNALADVQPVNP